MQTYIIDCGGWKGDSVDKLRKKFGDYYVYTFEANPDFKKYYKFENHKLINKAVWIYNGEVDFYLESREGVGSSIIKKSNTDRKIKVPCLDFSKWIINTFKKEDNIILKMDIEGAEYKVLGKMIKDGSIDYIDKLLVEFHSQKYPETATQKEKELLLGLKIETWD